MHDRIEQAIEAGWKSYTAGLRTLDGDYAVIRAVVEDALAALMRCDTCDAFNRMPDEADQCPSHRPHVVLAERGSGVVVLESWVETKERFTLDHGMQPLPPRIVARLDDE